MGREDNLVSRTPYRGVVSDSEDAVKPHALSLRSPRRDPSPRAALRERGEVGLQADMGTMDKISEVVAEQLGVDKGKVVGTATLTELGADSLDIVETVMALEETLSLM